MQCRSHKTLFISSVFLCLLHFCFVYDITCIILGFTWELWLRSGGVSHKLPRCARKGSSWHSGSILWLAESKLWSTWAHARSRNMHVCGDAGCRDWRKLRFGKCLTHLSTCCMSTNKSSAQAGTHELLFCSLCSTTSLVMSKDDLVCLSFFFSFYFVWLRRFILLWSTSCVCTSSDFGQVLLVNVGNQWR